MLNCFIRTKDATNRSSPYNGAVKLFCKVMKNQKLQMIFILMKNNLGREIEALSLGKKLLFVFLLTLFNSGILFAQQLTITGKVINQDKELVEFVHVILLKNDTIYVDGMTTDSLGLFSFKAEEGNYRLILEQFGTEYLNKVLILNQDIDLGEIEIDDTIALEGITINTRKKLIEQKVDRLVFNIENSVSASSGDLLDALRVTPGIQVRNNSISIVGKSNVAVMIEDRVVQLSGESLINFLRSISADEIKSIEVITTPPAKYEAEGNSGLINIKYKKSAKNAWNNSVRSSYIQTTYPALSIGNTFNYNKNKISFNTSFDVKKGNEGGITIINIDYPNQIWQGEENYKYKKDNYSGRINTNYQITEKSSIGAIVLLNQSNPNVFTNSNYNIYTNNQQYFNNIHTIGDVSEVDKSTSLNLNYRQALDTIGKKISIDIDYFNYKEDKSRFFDTKRINNDMLIIQQLKAENKGNINIENFSGKIDFEHPTNWAKISYGAKATFTKTNSDVIFYDLTTGNPVLDLNQTNEYEYNENIQALYFDIGKKINSKLQIKLGLRYEITQTKGVSLKANTKYEFNYHKLFPTVHTLYLIDDNNFLNLSYSRRINRPAFWELNPFRWYLNANSYSEGNPFLKPSYNDNFEFTHGYKQKWFNTLFVQIKSDGFSQLPLIDQNNYHQIFIRENYFTVVALGLAQSYTFNKLNWLESNLQGSGYYSNTNIYSEFKDNVPPQNGFGMNFSTYNSIIFNKRRTLIGEINYLFNSSSNATIYKQSSSGSLDFGLKILFLNKDLQFTVNIYDVLKTSNPDYLTFTNEIKQKFNNYYDNRFIRFSFRYSFGNKKINVSEKEFGNESERERIK